MKIKGTFELEIEPPVVINRKVMKCICSMDEAALNENSYMKTCGFYKNKYGLYESMGSFSKVMSEYDVECRCGKLMKKWMNEYKNRSDDEAAYGWCDVLVTCSCKEPRPDYLVEIIKC